MVISDILDHDTYKIVQLKSSESGRTYSATAHASQLKPWRQDLKNPNNEFSTDDENDINDDEPENHDFQANKMEQSDKIAKEDEDRPRR